MEAEDHPSRGARSLNGHTSTTWLDVLGLGRYATALADAGWAHYHDFRTCEPTLDQLADAIRPVGGAVPQVQNNQPPLPATVEESHLTAPQHS